MVSLTVFLLLKDCRSAVCNFQKLNIKRQLTFKTDTNATGQPRKNPELQHSPNDICLFCTSCGHRVSDKITHICSFYFWSPDPTSLGGIYFRSPEECCPLKFVRRRRLSFAVFAGNFSNPNLIYHWTWQHTKAFSVPIKPVTIPFRSHK